MADAGFGAEPRAGVQGAEPLHPQRVLRGSSTLALEASAIGGSCQQGPWALQLARVVQVKHLGDLRLRQTFTDGLVWELDFEDVPA